LSKQCNCVRCSSLSGNGHIAERPCPNNFKRKGEVCLWTNPNLIKTPIIDSLSSTEFPTPKIPITKRSSRLNRIPDVTELLYPEYQH